MGKWEKIRWILRRISAVAGGAAVPTAFFSPPIAAALGIVAALTGPLSIDLPRDKWTADQRREKLTTPPAEPYKDE